MQRVVLHRRDEKRRLADSGCFSTFKFMHTSLISEYPVCINCHWTIDWLLYCLFIWILLSISLITTLHLELPNFWKLYLFIKQ